MAFRDDRGAMRARVDQLEQDLAEAKRELEAKPAPAARARPMKGVGIAIAVIVALTALGGAAVVGGEGSIVLVALGVAGVFVAMLLVTVSRLLIVVGPNELAVISGRRQLAADGSVVGYRIVRGGRVLRVPILEEVAFMDLTNYVLPIEVRSAHTRGGQPVTLEAVANVKVAGEMPLVRNAVERFLGQSRETIARAARETLEGALREVLAGVTLDEARTDPLLVANKLLEHAEDDLEKLGLVLDTFKVQRIEE